MSEFQHPCAGQTPLTVQETNALLEALDDEHKAWATYDQVIRDFGLVRPFVNIRGSERRHIAALTRLFEKHGLVAPPNLWVGVTPRFADVRTACAAAVAGEIDNINLHTRLLALVKAADVRAVLERLRDASQFRHLPAFQRCLSRRSQAQRQLPVGIALVHRMREPKCIIGPLIAIRGGVNDKQRVHNRT